MKLNLTAPQATIISAIITVFGIVVTKVMDDWLDARKSSRTR
jgi:hypothetical protein